MFTAKCLHWPVLLNNKACIVVGPNFHYANMLYSVLWYVVVPMVSNLIEVSIFWRHVCMNVVTLKHLCL